MRAPPSSEKVTKECEHCHTPVTRAPSLMKSFRYCSRDCQKAANLRVRWCKNCGYPFSRPPSQMIESAQFCSKGCYDASQTTGEREAFVCESCGEQFWRLKSYNPGTPRRFCSDSCARKGMVMEEHPRWKGGRAKDQDGEELLRIPRPGVVSPYFRAHRKIASDAIGRLLRSYEHVLHVNNNHEDHRPDNLFICASIEECMQRINGSLPWPTESNLKTYNPPQRVFDTSHWPQPAKLALLLLPIVPEKRFRDPAWLLAFGAALREKTFVKAAAELKTGADFLNKHFNAWMRFVGPRVLQAAGAIDAVSIPYRLTELRDLPEVAAYFAELAQQMATQVEMT